MWQTSVSLLILCLFFLGCGSDEDTGDEDKYKIPVSFVSVSHPLGGALPSNGTITVTFDGPPRDISVSAGTVTVCGLYPHSPAKNL